RFYWEAILLLLDLLQLGDGIINIHCVALVIEPQNWAIVASPQRTNSLFHTGEAGVSVGILLSKDSDLLRGEPLHFHQIVYHRGGFFGVAGAVVEHIAVGRIAPQ